MDYTKVQTALNHVKDAITTKLDSIKSDVTNVNNSVTNLPTTLDSKFSALTSKVDGVKTDVAGVGSKVDGVKSDVAKTAKSTELSTLANNLTSEVKKSNLDLSKARYRELKSKFDAKVDVISVEGSGEVYLIAVDSKQHAVQVEVEVDWGTECFIVSTNYDAGFIYEGIVKSKSRDDYLTHAFGHCYTDSAGFYNYDLYKTKSKLNDYYQYNTRFLIKKEPLKFNKSFKITVVEPLAHSSSDTFECKIAYLLN